MEGMFSLCRRIQELNIEKFNIKSETKYTNIFNAIPNNAKITINEEMANNWLNPNFTNLTNIVISNPKK